MYAVLVIAAILLSVAPMHARTILAALPAGTPGHLFATEQQDQQMTRVRLASATRQAARPMCAAYAPSLRIAAPATPVAATLCIPAPSLGLVEHAPNAP